MACRAVCGSGGVQAVESFVNMVVRLLHPRFEVITVPILYIFTPLSTDTANVYNDKWMF